MPAGIQGIMQRESARITNQADSRLLHKAADTLSNTNPTPKMPQLDHLIFLVPHALLTSLPPSLTYPFTITPGGTHVDGLTENKLIILPSGTYIELIAFVPEAPPPRSPHWWADKRSGWIDWALTSPGGSADVQHVRERLAGLDAGVGYAPPVAGGRTRPDGVGVRWEVTFPTGAARGAVPFWCHDVTPREG
ncbi:hypothetical protein EJ06DRAFT_147353 [Trichodelitschia bisporula]|uniref:Glyoxalase-like domain-containing protein n=1 Tax=Trichodelitschia bisporula TaxID=703511 RepID=A0A6G1HMU5_9PEZI|nr:hypothetical protein EJ06DRAFT_147353 [Trichodelitschia bisporula]